jgi:hypothetical protein
LRAKDLENDENNRDIIPGIDQATEVDKKPQDLKTKKANERDSSSK